MMSVGSLSFRALFHSSNLIVTRLMSTLEAPVRQLRQARAQAEKTSPLGIIVLLAVGATTLIAIYALQARGLGDGLVLSILALLAVAGVFSLFGWAVGILGLKGARDSDVLLTALTEDSDEAIEIIDAEGRIVLSNPAMSRLHSIARSTAGGSLEHLFTGESRAAEAYYRLSKAVKGGLVAEEVLPLASRGLWLKVSARPLIGADGETLSAWRVTDITNEHARNARKLAQLQDTVRYLDTLPIGFMTSAADGRIQHMNAELAHWLGIDAARWVSGDVRLDDIIEGDNAALLDAPLGDEEERKALGGALSLDLDLRRQDGQLMPVRLLHRRVVEADGEVKGRTLVLDRASSAGLGGSSMRPELQGFARFFQAAPFGIAVLDETGRVVAQNGTFARVFFEARKGVVNSLEKILKRASDEDGRSAIRLAFEAALQAKAGANVFEVAFGADREATRRLSFGPVSPLGEDGARFVILYVVDATEQKALELKFAQSQKMDAVGQLAGGIAHDFNNVLQVIIGTSELYQRDRRPVDPGFTEMNQILQEANRAANLVGQLLAFSRKQPLTPKVLDLNDVLQDLGYSLTRTLGEKVQLKIVPGRELWYVRADRIQFQQVILNLSVNARDAMPDGGRLTIRTRNVSERESAKLAAQSVARGEYVLVEVEDSGTGMSKATVEKIFEPFFTTKDVGKGTGLGLSTVYGIVKQTGGYVFADSELGKGTIFRVYLPRHVPTEADVAVAPVDEAKKERVRDLTGSGRVLLVEDEDGVRSFAVRALQRQGYEVLEASTGVEALEVMEKVGGKVDVVISDVMMPEMDGPTLLKELRKTQPHLKFIFVSGYPDDAFRKSLADGEQVEFLPKPFRLPQLAAKVKETIGK
jgi:two-component system cell cycle sensor histidine kinase/response regulator CckA